MKSTISLRRVDDAVGVGDVGREALEELLVDGVEEVLLLGEVAEVRRRRVRWPCSTGRASCRNSAVEKLAEPGRR